MITFVRNSFVVVLVGFVAACTLAPDGATAADDLADALGALTAEMEDEVGRFCDQLPAMLTEFDDACGPISNTSERARCSVLVEEYKQALAPMRGVCGQ